jgi:hypothetical protein
LYVPAQSYQVRRRVCCILAKATVQFAVPPHLIFRKPTLLSCRDDVCILAGKTLIVESACLDGSRRLNCDSVLRHRRLMPQQRQIFVRETPGAEVGDNGIRVRGEFGGVDMEEIHACRYQAFGVGTRTWLSRLTCREPAVLAVIGDDRARAVDGCVVRFSSMRWAKDCGGIWYVE